MVNEKIVLIEFNSIYDGMEYINSSPNKFSFYVNGTTYNMYGNEIQTPTEYELYSFGDIFIEITNDDSPGQLYISDGFIKYYKEMVI